MNKTLRILGIRGVPAAHGGFETFAEHLALYLVERGWRVIVYCQETGDGPITEDKWKGIERIRIPVSTDTVAASVIFDWKAISHAKRHDDLCLTLGYNTAAFCLRLKARGIKNLINMDGIEWSRAKWGPIAKVWFWMNDWAGSWLGDHLIADHPEIKEHLKTRVNESKITTIAYGADPVTAADSTLIEKYGLVPGRFLTLIARPEPENSILEVVQGFSKQRRNLDLVILGNYDSANPYHKQVKDSAGPEVKFIGAIYDKPVVHALRFFSAAYVHGHQVGGTNPSLVEAMGAGNAVLAHDNKFNRWVAGEGALYFSDALSFDQALTELLSDANKLTTLRAAICDRFRSGFTWDKILGNYEDLLLQYIQPASAPECSPHENKG
jgi:glycosyltransferase involved in cell wall biosynthesis